LRFWVLVRRRHQQVSAALTAVASFAEGGILAGLVAPIVAVATKNAVHAR